MLMADLNVLYHILYMLMADLNVLCNILYMLMADFNALCMVTSHALHVNAYRLKRALHSDFAYFTC